MDMSCIRNGFYILCFPIFVESQPHLQLLEETLGFMLRYR